MICLSYSRCRDDLVDFNEQIRTELDGQGRPKLSIEELLDQISHFGIEPGGRHV